MPMNAYWRSRFAWSNSRHNIWTDCKKQYYFNYIKIYDGLPTDESRKVLWKLWKLRRMDFLKGQIIHDAIKEHISADNKGVVGFDAKQYFLSQFNTALANRHEVITEEANGFPIGNDKIERIKADSINQLETFCNSIWPEYHSAQYIDHENLVKFNLDGIPVWVKYDLFTKTGDAFLITDWKTGSEGFDSADESKQLGVYIAWASAQQRVPVGEIKGELVWLRTGNRETTQRSEAQLAELKEFVKKDAGGMMAVSSEADFPASPSRKKCMACNFLRLCEEGRQTTGV